MFVSMMKYKAKLKGKTISQISTYAPSSKTCSCCGHKLDKLSLDIRKWVCPSCGVEHDRDINAATNILFWGMACLPIETNSAGTAPINACGDTTTSGRFDAIRRYL